MLNDVYRVWNVDYSLEETKEEKVPHWGFEILKGKFKDTVIEIENIDYKDESLDVGFHFLNTPDTISTEEMKTKDFDELIECIISDFIARAIKDTDDKY